MKSRSANRMVLTMVFCIPLIAGYAQADINEMESIKSDPGYVLGYGKNLNKDLAEREAYLQLASKISSTIEGRTRMQIQERQDSIASFTQINIDARTSQVLNNTLRKSALLNTGEYAMLIYISEDEIQKYFRTIKNNVDDYLRNGETFLGDNRIGMALNQFYTAKGMLELHPDKLYLRSALAGKDSSATHIILDNIIKTSLSDIHLEIRNCEEKGGEVHIELWVSYLQQAVKELSFRYNDGRVTNKRVIVKDGLATLILDKANAILLDEIKLEIVGMDYAVDPDKTKAQAQQTARDLTFNEAHKSLSMASCRDRRSGASEKAYPPAIVPDRKLSAHNPATKPVSDPLIKPNMLPKVQEICAGIEDRNLSKVYPYFTADGRKMLDQMLQNAASVHFFRETEQSPYLAVYNQRQEIRDIPLSINYSNNKHTVIEKLNFQLDSSGQYIDGLSFGLSQQTLEDLMNRSERFGSDEHKYTLIHFLENYQTAYALKRLDYIEKLFDENALIIVGKVLKDARISSPSYAETVTIEQVEYIRHSKASYIKKLRDVFRRNEYLNIVFQETRFDISNSKESVYGIQLEQYYYSSSYSDYGFLFLMLDLSDSLRPLIYVRSWQPETFPDGSIVGLPDFKLY